MTTRRNDPLLGIGRMLALILQFASALVGGFCLILIPVTLLIDQGVITGIFDGPDAPLFVQYPLPGVALLLAIALFLAACFLFFGKLRAMIETIGNADPFTPENAQRLKMMAWLALAIQLLALVIAWLRAHTASLWLDREGPGLFLDFGREDIVGAMTVIVLFILARVFNHGTALREDLEGTV